ncbi:MAG: hypothetical protein ACT4OJ_08825 [Bacteroidota bacterium]
MTDLLLTTDGNLQITNDDLVIGESDQQQQQRLLLTEKGNVKQYPEAGVGTMKFLEAEDQGALLREISLQFSADGMNVKEVKVGDSGKILINAPYK